MKSVPGQAAVGRAGAAFWLPAIVPASAFA